ncbi:MAG: cell division protein FtsB [Janthinobacterium lividum]
MRPVTFVLIALLAFVQYPLWWGMGGWLRVHDLQEQFADQLRTNIDLKARNDRIAGEVDDLRNGTAAIEERARYELGMVKNDEVFVQFVSPQDQARLPALNSTLPSTRGQVSAAPLRVVPEPPAHGRAETKRLEAAAARHKAGAEKARAGRGATSPSSDR